MCALTVIGVAIFVASFGYMRLFFDAPLTKIELKGDLSFGNKILVKEQIMQRLNDVTFFKANLDNLQQEFSKLPQVASISLRRIWPNMLIAEISEQKPVARWGNNYFLNNRGQVFIADNFKFSDLPQLDFLSEQKEEALQSYQLFSTLLQPLKLQIIKFSVTPYGARNLRIKNKAGQEIDLVFGRGQEVEKLQRFSNWYKTRNNEELAQIAKIDLRYRSALAVAAHNRRQW